MNRAELITIITSKLKLIRTEQGYTQEEMSQLLGLSKKTLVEMEKGRNQGNWTVVVATIALFPESEIIKNTIGEDPLDIVRLTANIPIDDRKERTLGGKVWWKTIDETKGFVLQQNLVSSHFRIIDHEFYRYFSTFHYNEAKQYLDSLCLKVKK